MCIPLQCFLLHAENFDHRCWRAQEHWRGCRKPWGLLGAFGFFRPGLAAICPLAHKGVASLRIQRARADGLGHGVWCGGACGMVRHGTVIMPEWRMLSSKTDHIWVRSLAQNASFLVRLVIFIASKAEPHGVGGSTPETEVCLVCLVFSNKAGAFPWETLGQTRDCLVCLVFYSKAGAFPWEALGQNVCLSCLSCILQQDGGVSLGSPRPNAILSCLSRNSFPNKTGAFPREALGQNVDLSCLPR